MYDLHTFMEDKWYLNEHLYLLSSCILYNLNIMEQKQLGCTERLEQNIFGQKHIFGDPPDHQSLRIQKSSPNNIIYCYLLFSVVDAAGKPPSGFLQGASTWPGSYSECLGISVGGSVQNDSFTGRYCWMSVSNGVHKSAVCIKSI